MMLNILFLKIMDCIVENRLTAVPVNILEEILLETLAMSHLAEDESVGAHDTLDVVMRAVRVVGVAEGHLTVGEQLAGHLLPYHELAFAVAQRNGVAIAGLEGGEPRGTCCHHLSLGHHGDMAVDVVAEQVTGRSWLDYNGKNPVILEAVKQAKNTLPQHGPLKKILANPACVRDLQDFFRQAYIAATTKKAGSSGKQQ